jgi:hypothetical protein
MADVRGKIRSLAREAFEAGGMIEAAPPKPQWRPTAKGHSVDLVQNGAQEILSLKSEIHRLQSLLEGFQKVPQTFQGCGTSWGRVWVRIRFQPVLSKAG